MTTSTTDDAPGLESAPSGLGNARPAPMLRIPRSADPAPTTPRLRSRPLPWWGLAMALVGIAVGLFVAAESLGWMVTTGRGSGPQRSAAAAPPAAAPGAGSVTAGSPTAGSTTLPTPTGTGAGTGSGEGGGRRAPTAGADPADIKGWMTVQQVLDAYPVSRADLYARFGIPADTPATTTLSALKEEVEGSTFDVPALRDWVTEQLGR